MLERLKNIKLFQEKRYAVIGITINVTTNYEILIVDIKSDKLSVVNSWTTDQFEDINNDLDPSTPILLNFRGKGIINKKVALKGNYLKEVLFNSSSSDFYIYELHQSNYGFVSIARKEVLNTYFDLFEENKYSVLDYSIGPFVGIALKDILDNSSYVSGGFHLSFESQILINFSTSKESNITYQIGKDEVRQTQIPLFSTLLSYMYPIDQIVYDVDFLRLNKQELLLKKIFNKLAAGVGVFFLITLLCSYLLLSYYNDQYINYESQLYNLNHTYNQVKKLEEEKQNNILILQESGILKENFLSFYIHEIINSVPNKISLNSLQVNPTDRKVKDLQKILFQSNIILIKGNSLSSQPLNTWVKSLRLKKWISKIEILHYSNTKEKGGVFTLKIVVK